MEPLPASFALRAGTAIHVGYYILCLFLMLPLAFVTALVMIVGSMNTLGFAAPFALIFAPFYDPLGAGIRTVLTVFGFFGALSLGFFERTRATGFTLLAVAGAAACVFDVYTLGRDFDRGTVIFLTPSVIGIGLSAYCAIRSPRQDEV